VSAFRISKNSSKDQQLPQHKSVPYRQYELSILTEISLLIFFVRLLILFHYQVWPTGPYGVQSLPTALLVFSQSKSHPLFLVLYTTSSIHFRIYNLSVLFCTSADTGGQSWQVISKDGRSTENVVHWNIFGAGVRMIGRNRIFILYRF